MIAKATKRYQQSEKGKEALKKVRQRQRDKDFASIFAFICKKNDRVYVLSTKYTNLRMLSFKNDIKSDRARKDYPSDLRKDYENYGLTNFEFKILEKCQPSDLGQKKRKWIEKTIAAGTKIYNKIIN